MNFSLQQLRHFLAVAEAGSLGKAARMVHVSQPALTKSIHKLEEGVGLRLFDRAGAMTLTVVGREFFQRARRLLEESGELEKVVSQLRRVGGGQVVVGCGPMMPEAYVAPAVAEMMRGGPAPQVTIEIGGYLDFADQLRSGRLDFFVANVAMLKGEPDLEVASFPEERAVWFARPGHPLAGRAGISAAAFFSYPMVGPMLPTWVDAWFQQQAGAPSEAPYRFAVTCSHYPTLKAILGSTDCVSGAIPSILGDDFVNGTLVPLEVELPPLSMQAGVVKLRHRTLSPAAQRLVDGIQRQVASRLAGMVSSGEVAGRARRPRAGASSGAGAAFRKVGKRPPAA